MYARIHREADTYENYLKRPKDRPELWQAKHDLWMLVANYACFIEWKGEDTAGAVSELQRLADYLREWQQLHPDQLDPRTGNPPVRSVCHFVQSLAQVASNAVETTIGSKSLKQEE
jgi:hypothetical protein